MLPKMLKRDLILQIMNQKDHYLEEKNKEVTGLKKDELCRKIKTEFPALRPKTQSYLTDDSDENKKTKDTKKCVKK